jgi:predicted RNA-binding Zn-ribbon protein involved in translation (DUF1610 family)
MAQGRKGKLNFRCPRCLMREIDMDMLFDADRQEYYCLRCSFVGPEQEVRRLDAEFRAKYLDRSRRITTF